MIIVCLRWSEHVSLAKYSSEAKSLQRHNEEPFGPWHHHCAAVTMIPVITWEY